MRIDNEDVQNLLMLEKEIESTTEKLIKAELDLVETEIALDGHAKLMDIDSRQKETIYLELRRKTGQANVESLIDSWKRQKFDVKRLEYQLSQVKGMRDTIKKVISIIP